MNLKTNVLSIILAFTLALTGAVYCGTGFASAEAGGTAFTDLPTSHWAYSSVQKMQAKGIVKGYPDGSFGPSKTVTYGEFIKMAVVAVKGADDITNAKEATHWASGYYKYAIENGIFHSSQIAEKQLGSTISRDDMALICANAASLSEVNMKKVADKIPDVDKTTRNEYQIAQAYAEGLITGYEDGSFHPYGTLTRAEASTVILRIIDKSARIIPDGISSVPSKPKEDTTVNVSGSEYKTDYRGTYKTVKFSDYVESGITDSMKEQYYFPEELRVYNEGDLNVSRIYVSWEEAKERIANGTTTIKEPWQTYAVTGEVAYKCFVVKNGEIIQDTEMGTISGANSAKEDWTTTHIIEACSPTDFDYLLFVEDKAIAEWLISGESSTIRAKGDEIPRLYPNPFK